MSTNITINVTNNSNQTQDFFFFQQPAVYSGGSEVYSNSLLSTPILSAAQGGSVYTFTLDLQYYAAVQQAHSTPPVIGQPSGYMSALQPIDLTPNPDGSENNCSTMIVTPALGLTPPAHVAGVEPGAFRIISPAYDDNLSFYNGGSGMSVAGGGVVLSNFVVVQPSQNLDCQPVLQFYVAVGNYTAGSVMNFTGSSVGAALCDATEGVYTFNVSYNNNGTWTVNGNHQAKKSALRSTPITLDTNIFNEAGTAVICQGTQVHAAPLTIGNLTAPGALRTHKEYQVSVHNGRKQGLMLTNLTHTQATFD